MMRGRRWIIPIVVFFLSVIGGFIQISFHRHAVQSILDEAGRKGEPVVAILMRPNMIVPSSPEFRLYNLEGDWVRIAPSQKIGMNPAIGSMFFARDGKLYIDFSQSNILPSEGLYGLELTERKFNQQPAGFIWDHSKGDSLVCQGYVSKSPQQVWVFTNHYVIYDPIEGSYTDHDFAEPGPWQNDEPYSSPNYQGTMTADQSRLIISRSQSGSSAPDEGVYIYDVRNGTWDFLSIPEYLTAGFSLSADSESLVFFKPEPNFNAVTSLIDLATGSITTIDRGVSPEIWQNWVIVLPYRHNAYLCIYDIRNDMQKYELTEVPQQVYQGNIVVLYAIYEPPPP